MHLKEFELAGGNKILINLDYLIKLEEKSSVTCSLDLRDNIHLVVKLTYSEAVRLAEEAQKYGRI